MLLVGQMGKKNNTKWERKTLPNGDENDKYWAQNSKSIHKAKPNNF